MTNKCVVCGRRGKRGDWVSFHRFPDDIERRVKWLKSLKMRCANKWHYVCSGHFSESDYDIKRSNLRILKENAIPTLTSAFSNTSYKISRFPSNPEKKKIWFSILGFDEGIRLPKHPEICSDHFNPSDIHYKANGFRYINPDCTPQLRSSVFLDSSSSSSDSTVYDDTPPKSLVGDQNIFLDDLKVSPGSISFPARRENFGIGSEFHYMAHPSGLVSDSTVYDDTPPKRLVGDQNICRDDLKVSPGSISFPARRENFGIGSEFHYIAHPSGLVASRFVPSQKNVFERPIENAVKNIVPEESIPKRPVDNTVKSVASQESFPKPVLVKIGTIADLPPDFLSSNRKLIYLRDTSSFDIAASVTSQQNLVPLAAIQEKLPKVIRQVFTINDIKEIPAVGLHPYEEFLSENGTSSDSSSTDTASEIEDQVTVSSFSPAEHDTLGKNVKSKQSSSKALASDSSTHSGSESTDSAGEFEKVDVSTCGLTRRNPLNQDEKNEIRSYQLMEHARLNPSRQKEQSNQNLPAGSVSEERLIELLESESPLLTPELMFCKNVPKSRKSFFGDLTIEDFETEEEKKEFVNTTKRVYNYRSEIKKLQQINKRYRNRLAKRNSILDMISSVCDISEAKKVLEEEDEDDEYTDSASDTDEAEAASSLNEGDPVAFEKKETQINSFDVANQVQVTFLSGSDTAKESSLKEQLKKLSAKDITKSKKIRQLNNTVFMKNKRIDDLRNEIEKLKKGG